MDRFERFPSLGAFAAFEEEHPLDLAGDDDFDLDWPDERDLSEEEVATVKSDAKKVAAVAKMAAIDCDLTLLGIHTGGGYWQESAVELSKHLRPVFRVFIPELIARGILISIVTFSPQPQLIKEALEIALAQDGIDASEVVVMGGHGKAVISGLGGNCADLMHSPIGTVKSARRRGINDKQKHISAVIRHFQKAGVAINPSEIYLIDDDPANVEIARQYGMRSSCFNPDEPCRILDSEFDLASKPNESMRHSM